MKNQKQKKINLDITKFTFLRDLVLVRALRPEGKDGLIDPQQYEDKAEFGEVIKKGEDVSSIDINDIIRFGKYSTEKIRTNGEDYFIVHSEDISAVLKE